MGSPWSRTAVAEHGCTHSVRPPTRVYEPRRPRESPLFKVLSDCFTAEEYEERHQSEWGGWRRGAARSIGAFLECGLPEFGFARFRCRERNCSRELLLPFSCQTRGLCPSCAAKRTAGWAAWVSSDLARAVPHRQVVLSLPKLIRPYFKHDRSLLTDLARWKYECASSWPGSPRRPSPSAQAA